MQSARFRRVIGNLGLVFGSVICGCGYEHAERPLPPIRPAVDEGCVVAGVLYDAVGVPVSAIAVTATRDRTCNPFTGNPPSQPESFTTITDEQGRFRIAGLGKHPYSLDAVYGDLFAHESITFAEDQTFIPEKLLWLDVPTPETSLFVDGRVQDSAGNAVEGALVFLLSIDLEGKIVSDTSRWASTNEDGTFAFDHLQWNRWKGCALFAKDSEDRSAFAEYVPFGANGTILTLTEGNETQGVLRDVVPSTASGTDSPSGADSPPEVPDSAGQIHGIVKDADNHLVSGAAVHAVHKAGWEAGHGEDKTGPNGEFRLHGTKTGVYDVTAQYGRYFSPRVRVRAGKNRPTEVTLELNVVGGYIQGSVRQPDGTAYRGASINAKGSNGADYLNDRVMNPDGTFRLGPLRPGRYSVYANRDYRPGSDVYPSKVSKRVEIEIEPGGYVPGIDLTCEGFMQWSNCPAPTGPLRISGQVVDENGLHLDRAEVALYGDPWSLLRPRVYTNHEGRYEFTRLPMTECQVVVEPPSELRGGPQALFRAESNSETGNSDVDLVLRRCFSCTGRVIHFETGEPIREFSVGVAQHPNHEMDHRDVLGLDYRFTWTRVTDSEGRFALYALPPDKPAILGFRAPFRGTEFRNITPAETDGTLDVEIALKPGARLEGLVEDWRGKPTIGAYVEVQPHGLFQYSDAHGRFGFELPDVDTARTGILVTYGAERQVTALDTPALGSTATARIVLNRP